MFVVAEFTDYVPRNEEEESLQELETMDDQQWISEEGPKFIAGYVAHRFKNKYPQLGCPTREPPQINEIGSEYLVLLSRGGLMYPSEEFLDIARIIEKIFIHFHGPESLSKEKKYLKSWLKK